MPQSLTDKVFHAVQERGPITNRSISMAVDAPYNSVQRLTKRLVRYGKIEVVAEVKSHTSSPAKVYASRRIHTL